MMDAFRCEPLHVAGLRVSLAFTRSAGSAQDSLVRVSLPEVVASISDVQTLGWGVLSATRDEEPASWKGHSLRVRLTFLLSVIGHIGLALLIPNGEIGAPPTDHGEDGVEVEVVMVAAQSPSVNERVSREPTPELATPEPLIPETATVEDRVERAEVTPMPKVEPQAPAEVPTPQPLIPPPDAHPDATSPSLSQPQQPSIPQIAPQTSRQALPQPQHPMPLMQDNPKTRSQTKPPSSAAKRPDQVKFDARQPTSGLKAGSLAAVPSTNASSGDSATAALMSSWRAEVQAAVRRARPQPDQEREGRATVRFSVERGGHVAAAVVALSSGSAILDQAALAAVIRARIPPVPDTLSAPVELTVPIRFEIED